VQGANSIHIELQALDNEQVKISEKATFFVPRQ
jgi:hypothetical protein